MFPTYFKYITDANDTNLKTDFHHNLIAFHDYLNEWLIPLFSIQYDSIAVLIPVYNRPDQLSRAIDSVLNQTVAPTEIFVVDDGSDLPVIVSDSRVQVLRNNQNKGVSAARNFCHSCIPL